MLKLLVNGLTQDTTTNRNLQSRSGEQLSSTDALAAAAWRRDDTALSSFARQLEKFALASEDPELQAILSAPTGNTRALLDEYSNTPAKNATPPPMSTIRGFSTSSANKQRFVVTYKTPLVTADRSNATLGGQSVPTNRVSNMSSALSGDKMEASEQEIMSALGVVVRETVLSRISQKINVRGDDRGVIRGSSQSGRPAYRPSPYSRPNPYRAYYPYRLRRLQSDSGSLFDSDFQISLHMDVIECDVSVKNPFYEPFLQVPGDDRSGVQLLSEECLELKELFETDNLVDNVSADEVLQGQQIDYSVPPAILRARMQAMQAAASSDGPNDQLLGQQWLHQSTTSGINSIPLWQSWDRSPAPPLANKDLPPILIALIDSGVDYLHNDLVGSIWQNPNETCNDGKDNDGNGFIDDCYGWNFIDNSNDPMDDNGHGTAAAGLIAASPNNGYGISPVCWNCLILPIKALDKDIKGTVSGFVKALNYALLSGAKISNNSYGGQGSRFGSLEEAVRRAERQGMIFVAASGNFSCDADREPAYPASYEFPNVVSVASHNIDGAISDFSCYGKSTVHLSAPGENVLSLSPGNGFSRVNGTSFAAPVVAGVLGMILNENRDLSHTQLIDILLSTTDRTRQLQSKVITGGKADLQAAVNRASSMNKPIPRPTSPPTRIPVAIPPTTTTTTTMRASTSNSDDDLVLCLHDLCPHKAMCLTADTHKSVIDHPKVDPNRLYGKDVMICRCPSGRSFVKDEPPPDFPWVGNIGYCADVDECVLGNQCGERSVLDTYRVTCVNTPGSFECNCNAGFTNASTDPKVVKCVDVDECVMMKNSCPSQSKCLNLPGNYECLCLYSNQYWDGVGNVCRSIDRNTLTNCESPRTEVWEIDSCTCRVGYSRNKAKGGGCVRAGVLEAVSPSIYDKIILEALAGN